MSQKQIEQLQAELAQTKLRAYDKQAGLEDQVQQLLRERNLLGETIMRLQQLVGIGAPHADLDRLVAIVTELAQKPDPESGTEAPGPETGKPEEGEAA